MICFRHPEAAAVGACAMCGRGVCLACVRDEDAPTLSCSDRCTEALAERLRVQAAASRSLAAEDATYAILARIFYVLSLFTLLSPLVLRMIPGRGPQLFSIASVFWPLAVIIFWAGRRIAARGEAQRASRQ